MIYLFFQIIVEACKLVHAKLVFEKKRIYVFSLGICFKI